jgi:MFS family permease
MGVVTLVSFLAAMHQPLRTLSNTLLPRQQPAEPGTPTDQDNEVGKYPWYRPFEGNYAASLISAILALSPFIVVTTAYALFTRQVGHDIHASRTALSIIAGLSTAGYAWGALTGGDLIQRFRERHLFLIAETGFVIGCALSAIAGGTLAYAAGRILGGYATGLLLVTALPPVIQKFPPAKLPYTVIAVNIGFFGAVCIGPLLGGWVEAGHHWRWFFAALAAVGALNTALAALTLPDQKPFNPGMRIDYAAIVLAFLGVVLPFWASGELAGHGFASPRFAAPLFVGLICFIVLLVVEYRQQEPLSPIKEMWTTQSVVGTLVAMIAGGVFVSLLELGERFHMQVAHHTPLQTGILFWPLALGALITAGLFGAMLRTRLIPLLILGGIVCIIGGGALLLQLSPRANDAITLAAAGLLGLGACATVSPGLYLAGFPLPSQIIGRIFALVELVRSLADYIIAPVMTEVAQSASGQQLDTHGVHLAVWITLWLMIAFTVFGTALYILGRGGLPMPDLDAWLLRNGPAIQSTPLLARLRRNI